MNKQLLFFLLLISLTACQQKKQYDTIIRNGMIYDGNGGEPFKGDIAINNDTIAMIGDLSKAVAKNDMDAKRNAVAPGFIKNRGELKAGYYADIVIFDPLKIKDNATYDKPHQYATGISDVFVNGIPVLKAGEHTGNKPGRFVKGPGWKKGV